MNPCRRASLLLALPVLMGSLVLTGCNKVQSISILPANGSVVLSGPGQTAQFKAIATEQFGSAPTTTTDITGSVTWSVSNPSVATITAAGLATAVGAGYTQVTAESGGITANSDLTVSITANTSSGGSISSIAIIPAAQSVSSPTQTGQFLAIGTTTTGATINVTNQVAWSSSSPQIATIGANTGLATAVGQGSAAITALYTGTGGGSIVGTASFTVTGGTTEKYTAVSITPGTQSLSASGQTGQFIALGTSGTTGLQTDVTNSAQIKWSSSAPSIASVSAVGLVTGLSAGTTNISVELTNTDGSVVTGNATATVTTTPAPEPILSLTIIPSSITVGNLQDTGQFLAIGTFSTVPYVRDLTNSPTLTWLSSVPNVFPVNTNTTGNSGATAGIVSAFGNGNAIIIAEAKSTDGTIQTATATFACPLTLPNPNGDPPTAGTCFPGSQAPALLATLTVYNEGLNTTNWLVTASSATGTPNVLHCGPGSASGGSVCAATYPIGSTITLTAPNNGAAFGGWSSNCTQTVPAVPSATGPNACTLTLTTNDTVGAIFN
jgi:uncharacterized protein YjdB